MHADPKSVEPIRGDGPEYLQKLSRWTSSAAKYWEADFRRMVEDADYAYGEIPDQDDDEPGQVRVNIIHSTIQGLMPHVYAKNPDIAFGPTDGVEQSMLAAVKAFAGVLQNALSRSYHQCNLKAQMKAGTRTALTRSLVWYKQTYQREYRTDPVVHQRLADAQDNLAQLERLIGQTQNEGAAGSDGLDPEAHREELVNTIAALQAQAEVLYREGLVVDRVQPNHMILDPALPDLVAWTTARRMVEIIWMARDEAAEKIGRSLDDATTWTWRQVKDAEQHPGERARAADSDTYGNREAMVKWYEAWDHPTLTVYSWLQGESQYARDPWIPTKQPQQWYPYHPLAFHHVDGRVIPLNLVRLLATLQDEHNATRTQQAEHREVSIPTWVADVGTDRSTLKRHRDRVLGETVLVDANGRPLNQVIERQVPPPYNPALYDVSQIRVDIETSSGLTDAQRGAIARVKTLGEAELMQAGVEGRADEMRDTVEDCIESMARAGAEILVLELNPMQAARLAGPSAILSWPAADKRQLFDQVHAEVHAGTAGKPNRAQEQQTWIELLPVIERLQDQIVQMAAAGMDPSYKVELLAQTIRRFDESLEIDALLPQEVLAIVRQRQAMEGLVPGGMGALMGAAGGPLPPALAAPGGVEEPNVIPFPPAAGS